MKPFIVIERGGWWHAYGSKWAWAFRREPILRARNWQNFVTALIECGLRKA